MTDRDVRPRLAECVGLYRRAYERHGTDPFTAERLDGRDDRELLDLSVAYGLLAFDGEAYRVRCAPDATDDCWRSAMRDRADAIRRAVSDATAGDDGGATDERAGSKVSHGGRTYTSVFVAPSDDFDAVVRAVGRAHRADGHGVVLRSPGDYAGEVQRFADQLCDPAAVAETSLAEQFQKESSDVVGHDKDALEFRLFLGPP